MSTTCNGTGRVRPSTTPRSKRPQRAGLPLASQPHSAATTLRLNEQKAHVMPACTRSSLATNQNCALLANIEAHCNASLFHGLYESRARPRASRLTSTDPHVVVPRDDASAAVVAAHEHMEWRVRWVRDRQPPASTQVGVWHWARSSLPSLPPPSVVPRVAPGTEGAGQRGLQGTWVCGQADGFRGDVGGKKGEAGGWERGKKGGHLAGEGWKMALWLRSAGRPTWREGRGRRGRGESRPRPPRACMSARRAGGGRAGGRVTMACAAVPHGGSEVPNRVGWRASAVTAPRWRPSPPQLPPPSPASTAPSAAVGPSCDQPPVAVAPAVGGEDGTRRFYPNVLALVPVRAGLSLRPIMQTDKEVLKESGRRRD